ncbi:MAG: peptidyl-tRNA hydrolase Pth2 [Candidatus Bathyarchaeia archaeon]
MSENQFKLAVVIRGDLRMSCGKAIAQGGHAVFQSTEEARRTHPSWFRAWVEGGQRKVVLRVDSEEELSALKGKADSLGLPSAVISDLGLTELPPGTVTCLGVGPAPSKIVDKITGNLKLF